MNLMEQQVYEVLTTPIICDKKCKEITRKNGLIITPQKYYATADEDMSDFAVDFYEIIYEDNLLKNISLLKDDRCFKNKELAGDTINSFNTIANMYDGFYWKSGNIQIDPYLTFYKVHYHCLANFWVIPMRHGRKSSKKVFDDNFDCPILYCESIQKNWETLISDKMITYDKDKEEYPNYFRMFELNEFSKIHFYPDNFTDTKRVRGYYENRNGAELLQLSLSFIYKRAEKICKDQKVANELFTYFKEKNVLSINN